MLNKTLKFNSNYIFFIKNQKFKNIIITIIFFYCHCGCVCNNWDKRVIENKSENEVG